MQNSHHFSKLLGECRMERLVCRARGAHADAPANTGFQPEDVAS